MTYTQPNLITYIVTDDIWMIFLQSVIQNGNDHTFPSDPLSPCIHNIHIQSFASILEKVTKNFNFLLSRNQTMHKHTIICTPNKENSALNKYKKRVNKILKRNAQAKQNAKFIVVVK